MSGKIYTWCNGRLNAEIKNDMEYKNVVWDWNGTLLDDVKISVDTINVMLERKHLGKLTVEEYRSNFGFPEQPDYESIGFDLTQDD